ncbi:hypothetical protein L1285_07595 [Pseudoalteromonas sp. DL2-H2.2]|uniref:hypothetical protein n=1 Tax=Pseudoalteromonas sp. DL2-H2.2 TaxID=2908889 RepID=UPI001F30A59D|nr:hypothetical protein [Pseudoalteromonas sp. DL2-H2.2]MCF2908184.1 hypothetical protein [Pseudoalteromonas sp. DL2-H2.2]
MICNIKTLVGASLLCVAATAQAQPADTMQVTDYSTFYETQVNSASCGGYWDERRVWVCDYRTQLVNVSYKKCHYKLTAKHSAVTAPAWDTRTVLSNQSCPANWTIPGPDHYAPGGVYVHQHNSYFTQQEQQRVPYNCRWETRSVWVPNSGNYCPIAPQQ